MTKKIVLILAILSLVFLLRAWDDEELFKQSSMRLKPNVVVLMDNSGSMNEIIYHPGYNSRTYSNSNAFETSSGGLYYYGPPIKKWIWEYYDNLSSISTTGWYGRMVTSDHAYAPAYRGVTASSASAASPALSVTTETYDNTSNDYWVLGKTSGAYAKVASKGNSNTLNLTSVTGTFQNGEILFVFQNRTGGGVLKPMYLYGTLEGEEATRYATNYLKWIFFTATAAQQAAVNHFSTYGFFDTTQFPPTTIIPPSTVADPSNCQCDGQYNRVKRVFTRIQVAREVSCKVANDNMLNVALGLYFFSTSGDNRGNAYDNAGAEALDTPKDMSEGNNLQQYKNKVWDKKATTWTPLSEALADIWRDFKPGSVGNKDYLPVTEVWQSTTSYMKSHCQGNYVIIVTDGESTMDDFYNTKFAGSIFLNKPITRTQLAATGDGIPVYTWNYDHGWGDYGRNAQAPFTDPYDSRYPATAPNGTAAYCQNNTCWIPSFNGTDLLDDVAYFINHQDMFPDNLYPADHAQVKMRWPGNQNIVTYTIGFNANNDMLARTAANGDGKYFTSSNFQELSDALQSAITDIGLRETEMMFTTFAAPKQSFTYGKRGYIATFTPRNGKTVWQGYLKAYDLDDNGDFPALTEDVWDAGKLLAARSPDSRLIYTVKGGSLVLFNTTDITPQDLGVYVASDNDDANPLDPNEVRRNQVVDFIRGNNGYTDPYDDEAGSPTGYKMGDIFHFNPLVVSVPIKWKGAFDASYNTFYEANKTRSEVIYVGANGGMIHCFKVEDGSELWAFISPSHLPRLKYLTTVTNAAERPYYFRYFNDGKGIVKDIQVQIGANKEWKTLFIFGMGTGGKAYCALDITDPDPDAADPLTTGPKFLWELNDALLGCTEARPIIADINDGSEILPAVFLSGGVACDLSQVGTKPVWEEKLATTRLEGQALFTLHAYTGELLQKTTYGASTGVTTVSGVPVYSHSGLMYQIAAPPSLLDKNNDGIADLLYFFETGSYQDTNQDTGGRMWRMNVLGNPSTWIPNKIYQAPDTQTLYLGATLGFDKGYHLWALFGTGRRPDITDTTTQGNTTVFSNPSGQFVALIDDFSVPATPYTNTNLKDITTWFTTLPTDTTFSLASYKGFFFNFESYANEIFYEPSPLFLNNIVYLNTFSPWTPPPDPLGEIDLCETPPVTGFHQVYKFKLAASGNTISIPSVYDFGGKILGYGLLSSGKYKAYFGGTTPGGFEIKDPETITLDDIFGPVVWKEIKK